MAIAPGNSSWGYHTLRCFDQSFAAWPLPDTDATVRQGPCHQIKAKAVLLQCLNRQEAGFQAGMPESLTYLGCVRLSPTRILSTSKQQVVLVLLSCKIALLCRETSPEEQLGELQHEMSVLSEINVVQDRLASVDRSNARALHIILLFAIMVLVTAVYILGKN